MVSEANDRHHFAMTDKNCLNNLDVKLPFDTTTRRGSKRPLNKEGIT